MRDCIVFPLKTTICGRMGAVFLSKHGFQPGGCDCEYVIIIIMIMGLD